MQLTAYNDIPGAVRQRAQNVIFGELPKNLTEAKSPIDNLLGSLPIDEGTSESVKQLIDNGFMQSKNHLFFWWNRDVPKDLELIRPTSLLFRRRSLG